MAAHLFPISSCLAMIISSSSAENGSFFRLGSSWLNHLKRQLFPFLPVPKLCAVESEDQDVSYDMGMKGEETHGQGARRQSQNVTKQNEMQPPTLEIKLQF